MKDVITFSRFGAKSKSRAITILTEHSEPMREPVRKILPADLPEAGILDHFSAKKAVWLFVRDFDDLSKKEQEELLALRQASAMAETLYQLVQEFFRIVHSRQGTQLDSWLNKVEASAIPELLRLAKGLERDKAAVLAGLTLSHSNGQVEGQVTRIKLIKRMMFGRAGFALLRQRVLHIPDAYDSGQGFRF
jgi:hypothetical protein